MIVGCVAISPAGSLPSVPSLDVYRIIKVEGVQDIRIAPLRRSLLRAITRDLRAQVDKANLRTAGRAGGQVRSMVLNVRILDCPTASGPRAPTDPPYQPHCFAAMTATDSETGHTVTALAIKMPVPRTITDRNNPSWKREYVARAAKSLSEPLLARLDGRANRRQGTRVSEDITATGQRVIHLGNGRFRTGGAPRTGKAGDKGTVVDLKRVSHHYDPNVDPDVHFYTDITLNDRVPALSDERGREYAMITLYHIDPPLDDLPSREAGIDRGTDFRNPAMLVKAAYSNYVSPVVTNDTQRIPVPGHPIGHFYVKVEIPGYPTILTGSTTVKRADVELTDLTIGRELGIGGVLLTPQPGRLNPAVEVLEELSLRQRQLRVLDGLFYHEQAGRNVGPEYIIDDGNVSFARFRLPMANAKDALAMFIEYIHRGGHRMFGSLVNRPHRGTGAGCTPFAMSWLKASGILPFVTEPKTPTKPAQEPSPRIGWRASLIGLQRTLRIPWSHVGCDQRMGLGGIDAADYTIYDLLFHGETSEFIAKASEGLAHKVRESQGAVVGTLFRFGALSPFRDVFISAKRNDPSDKGLYDWAPPGKGWLARFWDNDRFSNWIKVLWKKRSAPLGARLVREGRFRGIEIDAMDIPRQKERFFADADRLAEKLKRLKARGIRPSTCQRLYGLDLQ